MESIFERILEDFGSQNGAKLAPKSYPKSLFALKPKNQLNASPLVPNRVRRVQVGSKNRPKIDQKMMSRRDGITASIFDRFCTFLGAKLGGKIDPKSKKIDPKKQIKK